MIVLGVDPGTRKCGLAVVEVVGAPPLARAVVAPGLVLSASLGFLTRYRLEAVALGGGTQTGSVEAMLSELGVPIVRVDERGTTLEARARYYAVHPPRGWRRLVPRGLLVPSAPIDDFAAVLIAERFLTRG